MGSEETSGARQAEHGRGSTMNTVLMVALGVVAAILLMDLITGPGTSGGGTSVQGLQGAPVTTTGGSGSYRDSDVENLIHITSVLRDAVLEKDPVLHVKRSFNTEQVKFAFGNVSDHVLNYQPPSS